MTPQPDQSSMVVIAVPAEDTRAKMYEALRDLQRERDDARVERDLLRDVVATLRAYIAAPEGDGPLRYTEALALADASAASDDQQRQEMSS